MSQELIGLRTEVRFKRNDVIDLRGNVRFEQSLQGLDTADINPLKRDPLFKKNTCIDRPLKTG